MTNLKDLSKNLNATQKSRKLTLLLRAEQTRRQYSSGYRQFQKKYYHGAEGFARDCIKWPKDKGLTFYQAETLNAFQYNPRQSVRGPHGLGKTTMAAILVLWFALTRDGNDWKVPTTASVWRQLEKFLWPEIHKWARLLKWDVIGRAPFNPRTELLKLQLSLSTGAAFALSSDDHTALEGAHADHIFYIFDESKSIQDATFDAAEGAFSGAGEGSDLEALALAISTPGEPVGRFHAIHSRKPGFSDWSVRHVTLEDAIKAKRITREWADNRMKMWGESSALYQNRVLGEFASADEDGVIPLAWINKAVDRWKEWDDKGRPGVVTSLGVDIGLGGAGSDNTVLAVAKDRVKIDSLRTFARGDANTATMQTAGKVKGFLDRHTGCDAYLDVIGIGAGVYHRLNEQDVADRVHPFNAAEKTSKRDATGEMGFRNKRAAMWWIGREMLDPDSGLDVMLPDDDELLGDLAAPHYTVMSGGNIQVESKKDIRKRIGRSTDKGDGVLQALTGAELAQKAETRIYVVGQGYVGE